MIGNNITLVNKAYLENNGNILRNTYGNGQELSYDYDSFNRIKSIHKMDGTYQYKYDNNGNIAKVLSNNYTEKYKYDIASRIYQYKFNNFEINYDYNSNNNVIKKDYILDNITHTLENTLNDSEEVINVKLDNKAANYTYDELGRLVSRDIDGYHTEYCYLSNGKRTTNLINRIVNNTDKYEYKYDKLNNITDVYYNNKLIKHYEYNIYNELIKESDCANNEITYAYDELGNLMTVSEGSSENTYEYGNTNWSDQLTKYNEESIVYDEIGNPIKIGTSKTLEWINGGNLNKYQDTSKNLEISYNYDIDGIRISKSINGIETRYYLENDNIIYEKTADDIIYYLYDLTGIVGLEYNNNKYYYVKNLEDDIIGIVNSNNEKIVNYEYYSWGELLSIKDNNGNVITDDNHIGIINPFRYRSYKQNYIV